MGPIVLIISYGLTKPIDIVKKLLSQKLKTTTTSSSSCHNNKNILENPKEIEINEIKYQTYEYNIKNKYFETKIQLLPYEEPINKLSKELLKSTEALFISFDAADKSFLTHLPKLCKLSEESNIELNLLITKQLFDDFNEGLSYGDVKDACKHAFDVIEVANKDDNDDEETAAAQPTTLEDYTEIIEALENHIWSNVASSSSSSKDTNKTKTPDNKTHTHTHDDEADADDLDEAQLEAYEALLTNIVNFKTNSANLNRDQMLDKAEKLAELFAEFMGED